MKKSYSDLRDEAVNKLTAYMDSLPEKQGCTLSYWVQDYIRFLKQEPTFDAKKLIRYKRGSVVKVHLGYKVGAEEGGLHYAIIVDSSPALSNKTLTVVPLTSIKTSTKLDQLHYSKLNLGNELHTILSRKLNEYIDRCQRLINEILTQTEEMKKAVENSENDQLKATSRIVSAGIANGLSEQVEHLQKDLSQARKMQNEIKKMKLGSIALVGQITTISKIRIYDPLYPSDVLSNIRFSSESMDKVDAKIIELFTKNKVAEK